MSTTLKIDNYNAINIKERSSLKTAVNPAAVALSFLNNNNVAISDKILIGYKGSETGELRTVSAVTGVEGVTTDAVKHYHAADEPVLVLFGSKIRIYRATATGGTIPADDAFAVLATIDIDEDQLSTEFVDNDGTSDHYYKITYFDGTNTTALNAFPPVRGAGYGSYTTLDAIRNSAGFEHNRNISEGDIATQQTAAQDYINGELSGVYTVPFTGNINAFIAKITTELAAGYLRQDQFGSNDAQGKEKIAWATQQLARIKDGSTQLVGIDANQTPKTQGLGFSSYPNNATESDGGGGHRISITDRY